MSSAMPIRNAHSNILISGACSAEVKTEGVRHGSPMKEAEHGEECADEGEGEVEDGKDRSPNEACRRREILERTARNWKMGRTEV